MNVQRNATRYAKLVRLFSFSASKSQQNKKRNEIIHKKK